MSYFVAVSDVHIGSVFSKQDLFYAFLKNLPADTTIFLLGDIVDTWKSMPDPQFYSLLSKFVSIRYCPGNHDEEVMLAQIISPFIYKKKILFFMGNNILFTHGDIYDPSCGTDNLWNRFWDILFYKISKFLNIDLRTKAHKITKFFYSKLTPFYKNVEKGLKEDGCDILVFGHTHCPGFKNLGDKKLFNLGCWYDRPYAFFIKGEQYAFVEITESKLLPEEEDFNDFR